MHRQYTWYYYILFRNFIVLILRGVQVSSTWGAISSCGRIESIIIGVGNLIDMWYKEPVTLEPYIVPQTMDLTIPIHSPPRDLLVLLIPQILAVPFTPLPNMRAKASRVFLFRTWRNPIDQIQILACTRSVMSTTHSSNDQGTTVPSPS